jgi:hypothetical protein
VHHPAFNEQCAHADELANQQLLSEAEEAAAESDSQSECASQQSMWDDEEDTFAQQGCVLERFMQRKEAALVALLRHLHPLPLCPSHCVNSLRTCPNFRLALWSPALCRHFVGEAVAAADVQPPSPIDASSPLRLLQRVMSSDDEPASSLLCQQTLFMVMNEMAGAWHDARQAAELILHTLVPRIWNI